jgi:sugar diacid utilization regulator
MTTSSSSSSSSLQGDIETKKQEDNKCGVHCCPFFSKERKTMTSMRSSSSYLQRSQTKKKRKMIFFVHYVFNINVLKKMWQQCLCHFLCKVTQTLEAHDQKFARRQQIHRRCKQNDVDLLMNTYVCSCKLHFNNNFLCIFAPSRSFSNCNSSLFCNVVIVFYFPTNHCIVVL